MPLWISLLRGINLASHNRVRMTELKAVYASLGARDIETYVQSGNVVFRADGSSDTWAPRIEDAIERKCGVRTTAVLRTAGDLRRVLAQNPFAGRALDPARVLVHFLMRTPEPAALAKALAMPATPEEVRIQGSEIYIHYPDGMARPKLSMPLLEKLLATSGTGRNWNTVIRLVEIAERLETRP